MFHARGPAAANDRSPNDDVVRGTATALDAADLTPALSVLPTLLLSASFSCRKISHEASESSNTERLDIQTSNVVEILPLAWLKRRRKLNNVNIS